MRYVVITFLVVVISMVSLKAQYLEKGVLTTDSSTYELKDKYIQDAREEVKQRKKIMFLQKKVKKLKKLGHKKQELLRKQSELIDTILSLQSKVDMLQQENDLLHQEMIEAAKKCYRFS